MINSDFSDSCTAKVRRSATRGPGLPRGIAWWFGQAAWRAPSRPVRPPTTSPYDYGDLAGKVPGLQDPDYGPDSNPGTCRARTLASTGSRSAIRPPGAK